MKKGWTTTTTTKLIVAASLGVLSPVLQLLGAGLTVITGIPGMSGIINVFVAPAMLLVCLFVVNQFGAATIMYTINGIVQLPLPLSGTPGFLPKVPVLVVAGILADVLYLPLKRHKLIASLVIGGLTMLYVGVATVEMGRTFGMPGIEQTAGFLYSALGFAAAIATGAAGGYLGYLIYQKVKDTSVVRRIQKGK